MNRQLRNNQGQGTATRLPFRMSPTNRSLCPKWLQAASLVVGLIVATSGCGPGAARDSSPAFDAAKDGRFVVLTVNYPLYYFAERIAGSVADGQSFSISFPAPPDVDPASWQPDDERIRQFQQADLVLLNGADYAGWLSRVTLDKRALVNTSAAAKERYLTIEHGVTHSHGPGGEHTHAGLASMTWLNPDLALVQAAAVHRVLVERFPDGQATFDANWKSLETDLNAWRESLGAAAKAYRDQPLLASHPVYQYLAQFGQWNVKSVHWEPDQLPGEPEWSRLDQLLAKHPARFMLWEDEPLAESRQKLQDRGIQVLVFRPCGNRPSEGDWLSVMQANVEAVRTAAPMLER